MGRKAWIFLVCTFIGGFHSYGVSARVANTTLQMPAKLPANSYTTANAFPGLTFPSPAAIVTPRGETNRVFIVEQPGRITVITNLASPTRTVFLDLTDRVAFGSEEGLLALAFHPGYATNGFFYVWYTTSGTRYDRLSRFRVDPNNPSRGLPNTELILINQLDEAENHNGGELLFGPDDGYLYLSIGDEGGSAANDNVQRIDNNFFSGVFRIDVDKRPGSIAANPHPANTFTGTINYAIPPDNPFIGTTSFNGRAVNPNNVRTEFWAVGLRNPWRMSFDPQTRLLYCGDVGSTDTEEINIITKGGNYGWNYYEGTVKTGGLYPPANYSPIFPIYQYSRVSGGPRLCVIGGLVYRGNRYSDLWGSYLFHDYVNGNIWSMRYEVKDGVTNKTAPVQIASSMYISSFGLNPATGDILLASQLDHQIKRLVPTSSSGPSIPPTLADTGAFSDLATLTPEAGIVPYDINVSFWSDNAHKTRWFSVPNPNLVIGFNPTNNWLFPTGTVWIKHFDLELTKGDPRSAKRLETRFLVRNEDGVYGVTYRWDSANNATLVPDEGMNESFVINDGGTIRTQVWHYPGRSECLQCHTPKGGFAPGFNTAQLNCDFNDGATVENQLVALSRAGYFDTLVSNPETLPALAPATDSAFSVEHRVRSYLAANCVQCHQPGGTAQGLWDARFSTPMSDANIIDGPLLDDGGNPANRVIKPGSIDQSMILARISNWGSRHMPPLATSQLDQEAINLLSRWVTNDLVGASAPGATAKFVQSDAATRGNWMGAYGDDGYWIAGAPALAPTYATVNTSAPQWIWQQHTANPSALQFPGSSSDRISACWYSATQLGFDFNFTDQQMHRVTLYFLDASNSGRQQYVEFINRDTGAVLDSRNLTGFYSGIYLTWDVTGNVTIRVTPANVNAVVSGIFFDKVPVPIPGSAQFKSADTATRGNWKGVYGKNGYWMVGAPAALPAYGTLKTSSPQWIWAQPSTNPNALQLPGSSGERIMACWYSSTHVDLDFCPNDSLAHVVSIYFIDASNSGRQQRIELIDRNTGSILDTRTLSNFSTGIYLKWQLSGNVSIRLTPITVNAVASGIFFD